ncbi:MAG: PAS domain S-box protein [Acetobacteraceae bacterium]|nr:PAS domain S-box protein [Acetobacteraceae bacterium]
MPSDPCFRRLMDAAPVLIWCADADRRLIYVNKVWLDFTGRTMEQEFGCGWVTGVHPDDHEGRAAVFGEHFARREAFRAEFRLRRHDGQWRWMLSTGAPRTDRGGEFVGFIGSCVDVTEMKEVEAQRQRDLEEKAALLQELHHRVKNNAQVFASLLGVQANRASDPDVKAALRVAAARAAAIAQQQIYDSGASAEFDLAGFVRRLAPTLGARRLDLQVEAPDSVLVPLAAAVPFALIIHELLANAAQHGFPNGAEGRVAVRIRRKREGGLCLIVRDEGVGFPEGASLESHRSAGLTIVRSLARQLGATLSLEAGRGTAIRLLLPHRGQPQAG